VDYGRGLIRFIAFVSTAGDDLAGRFVFVIPS
jgi:hypothetical protein